jgi:hypothetical protein
MSIDISRRSAQATVSLAPLLYDVKTIPLCRLILRRVRSLHQNEPVKDRMHLGNETVT